MSRGGRKKTAKAAPMVIDEELSTVVADPELASMFVADGLEHLGSIEKQQAADNPETSQMSTRAPRCAASSAILGRK